MHITRRRVLQQLGAVAATPAALPLASALLAMRDAAAEDATDYKALVCVFLSGGNDTFNTVLATDASSWSAYEATRSNIALKPVGTVPVGTDKGTLDGLGGVLALTPATSVAGRSFALHPRLSELQTLFNTDRRLAILANVGPLIKPLTKEQYKTALVTDIPRKLYSHNDQQNTWQALKPEGATVGWGGRFVDAYVPAGGTPNAYLAMSPAGNAVWLSGQTVRQYQVTASGVVLVDALKKDGNTLFGSAEVARALKRVISNSNAGHIMASDVGTIGNRSVTAAGTLTAALDTILATDARVDLAQYPYVNLSGTTTNNSLAQQLQVVARSIAVNSALGVKRQVFFVSMGGFDTHDNQNRSHAELLGKLDHALAYFDAVLGTLGLRNNVTTFTASEFGRTFTANADGTDHGWGAHHFIMGGAVKGGNIYGSFPTLAIKNTNNNQFDGSPNQLQNGALLPTTSVEQYGATLGKWFNLTDATLNAIFPNLGNFSTRNMGFMNA
jgi:uncharacterized protein (DUF1501 family)